MLRQILPLFSMLLSLMILSPSVASAELIVLSAPKSDDTYYEDVADEILEFHVQFAKTIEQNGDQVLILVDEGRYQTYADLLGADKLLLHPVSDIWMRDFSFSNVIRPVMFRYTPEGQTHGEDPQVDADAVQDEIYELAIEAGLVFGESDLLNDGGNFVDDYAGNVVISRKFLQDNFLSEKEGRSEITEITDSVNVAFIEADEQGGLEHADGVVSFLEKNVLLVNSYPEDPAYAEELKRDLRRGLPDVRIFEVVTPYDGSNIHDESFGSACGLYTNALVTPERIYFPQFGIPQDKVALERVRALMTKQVVPVSSEKVCAMGGGVRCMSWQLRGENAAKLVSFSKKRMA